MKKKLCIFLLLLVTFLPSNVFALKLSKAWLDAPLSAKVGESITVSFKMRFTDIDINGPSGIESAAFNLEYDESVLTVTNVTSNIPETAYAKASGTNGIITIVSEISDKDDPTTECIDKILFCGTEYTVNISFLVKSDTTKENTTLKVSEIALGLIKVEAGKEYQESDLTPRSVEAGQTATIRINQPTTIVPSPTPSTNTNSTTVIKSNNRFLKSLEIENYTISFDKYKYNYDIEVDEGVNSLNVKAEVQDSKAKYTITGNDDLAKNDNKVVIEVTAENGEKRAYTIYVKNKNLTTSTKNEDKEFKKASINIDKKYIKIACIIGGIILLIIIISFIVKKINDKKLDKLVDKF